MYYRNRILVIAIALFIIAAGLLVFTTNIVNAQQTAVSTFYNCTVNNILYYSNGDKNISGTCSGGYWWSTHYSRFLKIRYIKGDKIIIKGVPTRGRYINNAVIAGKSYMK